MNRLTQQTGSEEKRKTPSRYSDSRFIKIPHWEQPVVPANHIQQAMGPGSRTIYLRYSGRNDKVFINRKTTVNFKNDYNVSLRNFSICSKESGEQIFFLDKVPEKNSVFLAFITEGNYELRYHPDGPQDDGEEPLQLMIHIT